jgi:D-3-phosphoglycerate dehydrogenase
VNAARRRVVLVSEIARLGREQLDGLEEDFELVDRYDLDNVRDEDLLADGLEGAWGVVAGSESYTGMLLDRLPSLRIIARCGVGFDAIDVDAATARAVVVSTTSDANADGVADLTLALMLACLRRVLTGDRSVREAGWRLPGLSGDLTDATVGIIGLGRVGRNVARRLSGFGCRLLAVEPYPDREFCREYGVEVGELDTILPLLDVLTIHAPLNASTRKLIGARELARLKPSAVVVNTSRGDVVDQEALIAALTAGRLAGAGLDVYEREPLPAGHPLTRLDNVVLSPHAASFSHRTVGRMLDSIRTSLTSAAAGALPQGCLNPEARR